MPYSPPVANPCTIRQMSNRIGAPTPMVPRVGNTEMTREPTAMIVTAMMRADRRP